MENLASRPGVSCVEKVKQPRSTTSDAATPHIFDWLFLALIATIPLMQLGIDFPEGTGTIADLLFAVTLVVGAIPIVTAAMRRWNAPVYVCLSAYLIASLASTVFSDSPHKSAMRLPIDLYMVLLAVVALNAASSMQAFRRIAIAWMAGTAATIGASLTGIGLFYSGYRPSWGSVVLSGYGSLPPGNYPRVQGLFLNANMCCDYLIVSVILLFLSRKLGWLRPRAFWILAIGLSTSAAFTVSPGIGGLLLAAGIWFWQRDRHSVMGRVSFSAGIVGAVVFWLACTISPVNSGGSGWRVPVFNHTLEPSPRLLCWGEAYRIWVNHPLLGRGTGLDVPCPAYRTASGETQHLLDAHNMYLNTLATKGAVGLCALLGIFVATMSPPRQPRIPPDHEAFEIYNALRVAVIAAFLYGGLSGSFEHTRHLWVLLGLLAGARELAGRMLLGQHDGSVPARFRV